MARPAVIAFVSTNLALGIGPERIHPWINIAAGGRAALDRLTADGARAMVSEPTEAGERPSSAWLLAQGAVAEMIERHGVRHVIPFKTSRRLEQVAAAAGLSVLSAPASLVRRLENKLQLPGIARAANVASPRSWDVHGGQVVPGAEGMPTRGPWVLQSAVGFAGRGTVRIDALDDVGLHGDLLGTSGTGRLSELVAGEPMTVSGVVFGDGRVHASRPVRQLTGISACSDAPFGSCGNDYAQSLDPAVHAEVRGVAASVGQALYDAGFVGVYGIDVIAGHAGDVTLIEVNPRWTSGMSLLIQLQVAASVADMAGMHGMAHGVPGWQVDVDAADEWAQSTGLLEGAQVILYRRDGDPAGIAGSGTAGALHLTDLSPGGMAWLARGDARPGGEVGRLIVRGRASDGSSASRLVPEVATEVARLRASGG